MTSTKTSAIVEHLLAQAGKTDTQKLTEQTQDSIEDHILNLESTVSTIENSEIPSLETKIKRLSRETKKAKINLRSSKFAVNVSTEEYISHINNAQNKVDDVSHEVKTFKDAVKSCKDEIKKANELITFLKS